MVEIDINDQQKMDDLLSRVDFFKVTIKKELGPIYSTASSTMTWDTSIPHLSVWIWAQCLFWCSFLLAHVLEGSRCWLKYLVSWYPGAKPRWSSWLGFHSPLSRHLRNEAAEGHPSLLLFVSLSPLPPASFLYLPFKNTFNDWLKKQIKLDSPVESLYPLPSSK